MSVHDALFRFYVFIVRLSSQYKDFELQQKELLWNGLTQQDAQEYLSFLLDKLTTSRPLPFNSQVASHFHSQVALLSNSQHTDPSENQSVSLHKADDASTPSASAIMKELFAGDLKTQRCCPKYEDGKCPGDTVRAHDMITTPVLMTFLEHSGTRVE